MMKSKERFYPEVRFGGFSDIDGTVAFYSRVNSLVDSSSVVLDVGCGRGAFREDPVVFRRNLRILKGKAARVIGIDTDRKARDNPFLDDFRLIQGDPWPVDRDSIDLLVCDYVLEHIGSPDQFFAEICRVLKDGGYLCVRTTNRWSYFAVASTLIPNRHHSRVLSVVQESRKEEDVFPTVYKCNSVRKLRHKMKRFGFDCAVYGYEPEPSYLAFSRIAYYGGVLYQRFAPGVLKSVILAFGRIEKCTV